MREVDDTGEGECLLLTTNYSLSLSLFLSLFRRLPSWSHATKLHAESPTAWPAFRRRGRRGQKQDYARSRRHRGGRLSTTNNCPLSLSLSLSLCFDVCHPGHTPPAYMHNRSPPGPPSGGEDAGGKARLCTESTTQGREPVYY